MFSSRLYSTLIPDPLPEIPKIHTSTLVRSQVILAHIGKLLARKALSISNTKTLWQEVGFRNVVTRSYDIRTLRETYRIGTHTNPGGEILQYWEKGHRG